jgi:hypothetical protein
VRVYVGEVDEAAIDIGCDRKDGSMLTERIWLMCFHRRGSLRMRPTQHAIQSGQIEANVRFWHLADI